MPENDLKLPLSSKPTLLVHLISSAFIALGIVADQLSKLWVLDNLPGNERQVIPGFLSLQYAENRNMAFGIGSAIPPEVKSWILIAMTSALALGLAVILYRSRDLLMRASLVLVLSGAVGNIIDRIRLGFVVDFIRWYGGFSWPNFNVADSLICIGVGLMFIAVFSGRAELEFTPETQVGGQAGETEEGAKKTSGDKGS